MRAQHQRLGILRRELLHDPPPQHARGAQLRDLEVEVHPDREEERQAPGEFVDVHAASQRRAHVFLAVGQREGELQRLVRAGFLHVVARDRDRVEPRHVARGVADDVGDDPHRRLGRIDVGVADHELLEDVVLDGPRQPVLRNPLLLGRDDVAGEHGQHGAVHRHRHRNLVERDAVEQDLHVLDGIDRDAGLADVADHARMVRVVAAVRGEVERDRHALPAAGERAPVERVGFLGRGKARVLADGPRAHRVHRRLRPAQERLEAGQRVGVANIADIGRRVERLDARCRPASATRDRSSDPPGALFAAARRQSSSVRSGYRGMSEFAMSSPCPWSDPAPRGKPAAAASPPRPTRRAKRAGARSLGGRRPALEAELGNRTILLQRGLPSYPFPGRRRHGAALPGFSAPRRTVTMARAPVIGNPSPCHRFPGC